MPFKPAPKILTSTILCWAQENTGGSRGSQAPTATLQRDVQRGRQELKAASHIRSFTHSFNRCGAPACSVVGHMCSEKKSQQRTPQFRSLHGRRPGGTGTRCGCEISPTLGRLIPRGRSRPRAWLQCLSVPPSLLTRSLGPGHQELSAPCSQQILPPGVLLGHLCDGVTALSDTISSRI